MKVLLGLSILALGLAGAFPYLGNNLIVGEAVSVADSQPDPDTQFHYAVVKGDRQPVHYAEIQVASVALDHPVQVLHFFAPTIPDDEKLRLSLDPDPDSDDTDAESSDNPDADPVAHDRNVRVADASISGDPEQNDDPKLSKEELCNAVSEQAQANELPAIYFANLIWFESRFRHDAVSPVGALGVAQMMPKVAVASGVDDPFNPLQAIPASARMLRDLRGQFGNLGLAAAAYNAGPHRVRDWLQKRRRLPRETRDYVLRVTGKPVEHWRAPQLRALAFAPARRLPCRNMPVFVALEQEAAAQRKDEARITQQSSHAARSHLKLHRKSHLAARKHAVRLAAKP